MGTDEKKERVIHTRVSETLDAELRKKAETLGVSVSNLVRNVLTNTFDLVDGIVSDSASVARSARRRGPSTAEPGEEPVIVGWQPFTLEVNAVCARSNALLPRGTQAAIAVLDGPGPRPIVSLQWLKEHRDELEQK